MVTSQIFPVKQVFGVINKKAAILTGSKYHLTKSTQNLRANAQKNRAKSANRGHSSKPNLPSFSVCNRVLMSL